MTHENILIQQMLLEKIQSYFSDSKPAEFQLIPENIRLNPVLRQIPLTPKKIPAELSIDSATAKRPADLA